MFFIFVFVQLTLRSTETLAVGVNLRKLSYLRVEGF